MTLVIARPRVTIIEIIYSHEPKNERADTKPPEHRSIWGSIKSKKTKLKKRRKVQEGCGINTLKGGGTSVGNASATLRPAAVSQRRAGKSRSLDIRNTYRTRLDPSIV